DRAAKAQAEAARMHSDADALKETVAVAQEELAKLRGAAQAATEREERIAELEAKLLQQQQQKGKGESGDIERRSVAMSQRLSQLEAELERAKDDLKQANAEARKYRALAEAIDPPGDRK